MIDEKLAEVVAWCGGDALVGDAPADEVVPLLVEIAFAERHVIDELEPQARAMVHCDRSLPAQQVLDAAHRAIFHAVLAWRTQRVAAMPADFPAHREEERALVQWVLAMQRDHSIRRHLVGLVGCATVDEVRERARKIQGSSSSAAPA